MRASQDILEQCMEALKLGKSPKYVYVDSLKFQDLINECAPYLTHPFANPDPDGALHFHGYRIYCVMFSTDHINVTE